MTYLETPAGLLVRFHTGEAVVTGLLALARERGIGAGWVQGLGALEHAEIGYFDPETRSYLRRTLEEDLEVAPLVGNLGRLGEEPIAHLHVCLGRRDFSALAGHLFAGRAGATLEVSVWTLAGVRLERRADAATGLNLLALPKTLAPAP